jgi:hypothetical protein
LEAVLQFGADFADFHSRAYQKFTAQEFVRALFIGQFSNDATILAVLVPAEAAVGYRFGTDVLKAPQNGVLFRNLKHLPKYRDFDKPLVGAEYLSAPIRGGGFRHLRSCLL